MAGEGDPKVESVQEIATPREKRYFWDPNNISDWFEKHPAEKVANLHAAKVIKFLLKGQANLQIKAMKMFLGDNIGEGAHTFDKYRKDIAIQAEELPNRSPFKEQGRKEQTEIQRWFFSIYIGGLFNSAMGDSQLNTSLRTVAWSLLANDARTVLAQNGQMIDTDWVNKKMASLLRTNRDPKPLGEELSRFVRGEPDIIHEQSLDTK